MHYIMNMSFKFAQGGMKILTRILCEEVLALWANQMKLDPCHSSLMGHSSLILLAHSHF